MSRRAPPRIAFFDVDKTVLRGATTSHAIRYFVAAGRMSARRVALGASTRSSTT